MNLTGLRPVPRIAAPDRETFERSYLHAGTPVIMTGLMDSWPALSQWNSEYLEKVAGSTPISVAVTRGNVFRLDPKVWEYREMALREFLALRREGAAGVNYYMQENDLRNFGALGKDIPWPPICDRKTLRSVTLSFGPTGAVTPLHYDFFDNCAGVITGRKRFIVFPPSEIPKMGFNSPFSSMPHISQVDLTQPDYERFPQLKNVSAYEAALGPGDVLFVPVHWSHQVFTDEESLSVNFWFFAPFAQRWLTAAGLRTRPTLLKHWPKKAASLLVARVRRMGRGAELR